MISFVGSMERAKMPRQIWAETRQRLEEASARPTRARILRLPRWSFVPAGAVVAAAALLLVFMGGPLFFSKHEADSIPITVYLQEHVLSYSDQVLPSNPLSELAVTQTEIVTEETRSDEPMSELEMLMEVHYGTYSTNGS